MTADFIWVGHLLLTCACRLHEVPVFVGIPSPVCRKPVSDSAVQD